MIKYFSRGSVFFDYFCLGKKNLVFNILARNLKVKYRRSVFGVLWTLLSPLGMTAVFYFVFKVVLDIKIPNYLVYILSGMLPWVFFSQTLAEATEVIVSNGSLSTKAPIPQQVFPFVGALTNFVTFTLSIPVLILVALVMDVKLGLSLLILPIYMGLFFFLTYGFAVIFSIGNVFFRDLKHLITILLQVWFYGTPVLYLLSMVPENLRWLLYFNPVVGFYIGVRQILISAQWPDSTPLLVLIGWTLLVTAVAMVFQRKLCPKLVEYI